MVQCPFKSTHTDTDLITAHTEDLADTEAQEVLVVLVVLAEVHTLKAGTLMEEALGPTEEEDQITHPHITTEVIDAN